MKRYMIFYIEKPYASGGMSDFAGFTDSLDILTEDISLGVACIQAFDSVTGNIFVMVRDGYEEFGAWELSPITLEQDGFTVYTHLKRGGTYKITEITTLQMDGEHDEKEMVTYQNLVSGKKYTRLKSEFLDGRFTVLVRADQRITDMITALGRATVKDMLADTELFEAVTGKPERQADVIRLVPVPEAPPANLIWNQVNVGAIPLYTANTEYGGYSIRTFKSEADVYRASFMPAGATEITFHFSHTDLAEVQRMCELDHLSRTIKE